MNLPIRTYRYPLKQALHPTPEFAKKRLADFSVNVGLKCGHDCTYCCSGAVLRYHKAFRDVGENPFHHGYAIVDPDLPEKLAAESKRKRQRALVQLCTTVDAWCPAAQEHDLGRRCLEALLREPGWTVRILTKNAAVTRDFDLIEKHRDRVLVGLSLTATADKDAVLSVIEPQASPVSQRMLALHRPTKGTCALTECFVRCYLKLAMPRHKSKCLSASWNSAALRKCLRRLSTSEGRD